ncbi:MAG TPA: hypothetical protein VF829_03495 [Candidatus Paceibacterota bacterium]
MRKLARTRHLRLTAALATLLLPLAVGAASNVPDLTGIDSYKTKFLSAVNTIVLPILLSIAFIVFVRGVYTYFFSESDSAKRSEGAKFVLYAVIGFVLLFSVWGLVNLVWSVIGLGGVSAPPPYQTL